MKFLLFSTALVVLKALMSPSLTLKIARATLSILSSRRKSIQEDHFLTHERLSALGRVRRAAESLNVEAQQRHHAQ